jgi:predicted HTH domain antitoxin
MAKPEVEIRFTLPLDPVLLPHKVDAGHKAREVFVLELLRQGDISAGKAASLLNISRWDLSELMYEAGISPFDDSLTAETLDAEVKSALKDFDESER